MAVECDPTTDPIINPHPARSGHHPGITSPETSRGADRRSAAGAEGTTSDPGSRADRGASADPVGVMSRQASRGAHGRRPPIAAELPTHSGHRAD